MHPENDRERMGKKAMRKTILKFFCEILLSTDKPLLKIAIRPIIKVMLIKFAPKMLPKEKFGMPLSPEETPTKSSGMEVVKLIKIKAILNSEILKSRARCVNDRTSNPPDFARKTKEIIKIKI